MNKNKMNKTLVSIAGAAHAWGMSEAALRRRIHSGHIEAVKDPGSPSRAGWLIEAATLDALRAARWCSKEEALEVATR